MHLTHEYIHNLDPRRSVSLVLDIVPRFGVSKNVCFVHKFTDAVFVRTLQSLRLFPANLHRGAGVKMSTTFAALINAELKVVAHSNMATRIFHSVMSPRIRMIEVTIMYADSGRGPSVLTYL